MRLYVTFFLLMVAVNGEFDNKRNLIKTENNALKKRAPALSTVSSPANAGVEYADTKQQLADKSPSQREYATPAPQFSKFSDLLAGQAPSYQAAIASQLFSPVSVYQPRTGTPTTYEVSAPVPSQLAYSEHFQQPNLQYNSQVYNSKLPTQPEISQQDVLAQTQQIYNQQPLQQAYQQQPAYQQPLQQTYQQPLQQTYQQLPQTIQSQAPQLSYNQISPAQFSAQQYKQLENQPAVQALQYQQSPKAFYSDNQHSLLASQYNLAPQQYYSDGQQQYQQPYVQEQPAQNVQYIQPAVTYRQDDTQQKVYSQPAQSSALERQQFVAQNYQTQPQGPVSFTKISQDQAQSVVHHPLYQQNVQQAPSQGGHENLSYFRPGPQLQIQPQVLGQNQPQSYQPQVNSNPNSGYKGQSAAAAPTFPAVQYFGKYAQSIFNKNQQ
ncbi:PREDICTED: putative mediator of RNA polymerase II transcription subunit 12 [Papilio xuthus]|uniref:Mediator of RNA polymerase II transcription subunit 12 n=1 Tax=Papilio xuthus TaxID=66420 RepID=A0AAJ6YZB8_PAPXU|nr:PREDICTED: putative mediator of RNA polymerase II transcription subunit 12 [Papilio xuthus]